MRSHSCDSLHLRAPSIGDFSMSSEAKDMTSNPWHEDIHDPATSQDTVAIAVMGCTGAGKTTFVNLASNSDLRVGDGPQSCTSEVQVASPFFLDGRMVTLIDTPGFDDTVKSEAEILREISDFLAATYEQGRKLNGVIFLHRISDQRMGGVARRNFRLFRQLCGDDALKNVVVVTNMWGEVMQEVGEKRERELCSNELFFKTALDQGARILRHDNTAASALGILREIMGLSPTPLLIQRECVDENKSLAQTNAGLDLQADLAKQAEQHRRELNDLECEMEEVMSSKDVKRQGELGELTAALADVQGQLVRLAEENRLLREERESERQAHAAQIRQLLVSMEEQENELRMLQKDTQEHKRGRRKAGKKKEPSAVYQTYDIPADRRATSASVESRSALQCHPMNNQEAVSSKALKLLEPVLSTRSPLYCGAPAQDQDEVVVHDSVTNETIEQLRTTLAEHGVQRSTVDKLVEKLALPDSTLHRDHVFYVYNTCVGMLKEEESPPMSRGQVLFCMGASAAVGFLVRNASKVSDYWHPAAQALAGLATS